MKTKSNQAGRSAPRRNPPPPADPSRWSWLWLVPLVAMACTPVAADDFWWQASCGRAVFNGHVAPSRHLLDAETLADADWLGGLPLYLVFTTLDDLGLVLWKVAVATLVAVILGRQVARLPLAPRMSLVVAGLLVTHAAWDPSPRAFDLLGLWLCFRLSRSQPLRSCSLFATTVGWCNLSPWGILSLAVCVASWVDGLAANDSGSANAATDGCRRLLTLALMSLAVCLTPRGWWTWRDSLLEMFPLAAADAAALRQTHWQPLWQVTWDLSAWSWMLLAMAALAMLCRAPHRRPASIAAALFLGAATASLAATGWWLALILAENLATPSDTPPLRRFPLALMPFTSKAVLLVALAVPIVVLAGRAPGWPQRLGWGLDPGLDVEPLREALEPTRLAGRVHAVDVRAAGMMCWLQSPQLKVDDVPGRARIGGRLHALTLLHEELCQRREVSYFRDDGSQGGWRLALARRNICLLLVPVEHTELLAGLADSHWRPLSWSSLVMPLGQARDPNCSRQLAATREQQQRLTWGAWSAVELPTAGSSTHVDLWGLVTRQPDARTQLRQAGMLRAYGLPLASVRLLLPVLRQVPSEASKAMWRDAQLDLAWQERLLTGGVGRWRLLAAASDDEGRVDRELVSRLLTANEAAAPLEVRWQAALAAYRYGRVLDALAALSGRDAEESAARAWLHLEAGQVSRALEEFARLSTLEASVSLKTLAQHALGNL